MYNIITLTGIYVNMIKANLTVGFLFLVFYNNCFSAQIWAATTFAILSIAALSMAK